MPVTAAVLLELLRAGMTAEEVVEATERIERDEGAIKPRSVGAERTRRWRERHKASQSVTKRHKASQASQASPSHVTSQASQSVTKRHQPSSHSVTSVTKRHKASRVTLPRTRNPKTLQPIVPYNKKKIPKKKTPSGAKEKGSVTGERASLPTGWQTVRPQKPRGLASRNPPMRPIGFATIGAAYPAATVAKSIGWRHGEIGAGRRPSSDRVVLEANLTDLAASQPCGLRF